MTAQEQKNARKLICNLFLFTLPLACLMVAAVIIDPFNITGYSPFAYNKEPIATMYDERLWKLNQLVTTKPAYLLIGDSRAQRIKEHELSIVLHNDWHCTALSGATLIELIDTFWFATRHMHLKELMFCINFDRYNDWQTASGVHHAQVLIEHPLQAVCAPEVWKATIHTIVHSIYPHHQSHQKPPVSKEQFWQEQLKEGAQRYRRYVAPIYAAQELEKMAAYCKEHQIQLTFVVLPTHIEFQQLVAQAGLEAQQHAFKQKLAQLAQLCDLDNMNDFTQNAEHFSDPWHTHWNTSMQLVQLMMEHKHREVC